MLIINFTILIAPRAVEANDLISSFFDLNYSNKTWVISFSLDKSTLFPISPMQSNARSF